MIKKMIREEVLYSVYLEDGPVTNMIDKLKIYSEAYQNAMIESCMEYDGYSDHQETRYFITAERLETDEEYVIRVRKEKKKREAKQKRKERELKDNAVKEQKQREKELELLKQLQEKYKTVL